MEKILRSSLLKSGNRAVVRDAGDGLFRVYVMGEAGSCYTEHRSFGEAVAEWKALVAASWEDEDA